jgi:hypothetical protein
MLGFGLQDYSSDVNGKVNSVLPVDVNNFLNRIYLHLESDGRNLSRMELGSGLPDCFHIFYLIPGQQDYLFLDNCRSKGYKIMISPHLLYFVRNYNSDNYTSNTFNRVFINV